jgi:hypothetical protein
MLFFSYFAKNFYPLQKSVFKFHPLFILVGKRREAEERGEGFGEKEFHKKECLLLS